MTKSSKNLSSTQIHLVGYIIMCQYITGKFQTDSWLVLKVSTTQYACECQSLLFKPIPKILYFWSILRIFPIWYSLELWSWVMYPFSSSSSATSSYLRSSPLPVLCMMEIKWLSVVPYFIHVIIIFVCHRLHSWVCVSLRKLRRTQANLYTGFQGPHKRTKTLVEQN